MPPPRYCSAFLASSSARSRSDAAPYQISVGSPPPSSCSYYLNCFSCRSGLVEKATASTAAITWLRKRYTPRRTRLQHSSREPSWAICGVTSDPELLGCDLKGVIQSRTVVVMRRWAISRVLPAGAPVVGLCFHQSGCSRALLRCRLARAMLVALASHRLMQITPTRAPIGLFWPRTALPRWP